MTPPVLDQTIRKCLAKNADERWQSASDLATQLIWTMDASATGTGIAIQGATPRGNWTGFGWVLSGVLGLLLIGAEWAWMSLRRATTARPVMRFSIELPVGDALGGTWYWYPSVAISEDGSQIAYVGHRGGESQIYVRGIAEMTARAVPGTERADMPFFSPDGQWLGIYSGGMIKKVPLATGPTVTIARTAFKGGTWGPDDTIYSRTARDC